ncbi:MAG: type I-U CRISPR-associated RAMP protein Csb1/Cas7u [Candidatus Paceibacterota bacterium]
MNELSLSVLQEAVSGGVAAFRAYIRLQPAGGTGTKVFPPTYSGGVYAMETRRITNAQDEFENQSAVLLDSVQSQANRLEECLRNAWEESRLRVPVIYSDFSEAAFEEASEHVMASVREIGRVTTFDAPHRIADAIFRDSITADDVAFREAFARAFDANLRNATALFELCPAALVFGTWDSTGSRGGLGNKFPRALVSEIVGINAVAGVRTSSRLDPLAISSKVPLYKRREDNEGSDWTVLLSEAAVNDKGEPIAYESKSGKGNPSAANHSNVTPDIVRFSNKDISETNRKTPDLLRPGHDIEVGRLKPGGVTIDYALQTIVLSLPALRRLQFPVEGEQTAERNRAARTVLAALGLVAIMEQYQQGAFLRSRCDLVPETAELTIERVRSATVKDDDKFTLTPDEAIAIYDAAVAEAVELNLPWQTEAIALIPNPDLVGLVVASRQFEFGEAQV